MKKLNWCQVYYMLPFFSFTDKNKNTLGCSLSLSASLSLSLPPLPILSDPCRRSQLFSQGSVGQDVIVVMVTDGCTRFTKTNFSCSEKKKPPVPHISSRAFTKKQVKTSGRIHLGMKSPSAPTNKTTCVYSVLSHR